MIRKLLTVVLFVAFFFVQRTSANTFEDLDSGIWTGIDKACQSVAAQREKVSGPVDTLFLRIVEFTTLGYRSHSVFPSAAKSLLRSNHFDPKLPTVIFAHGFTDSPLLVSGQTFAAAYKIHGNFNILAIDSSKLIKMLYMRSATLVKYIGETLGVVLVDLVNNGVDIKNVHLVGHSLGAHICGFAGKAFQILKPGHKLPRITGMDPAGPCFFDVDSDQRLTETDAEFVDIIHTNIGVYGLNKTIGSCDFFPNNGGMMQAGCFESVCSHNRAWMLWEESVVRQNAFIGVQCESGEAFQKGQCRNNKEAVMGLMTPSDTRGKYYLKTRGFPLFGMGKLGTI